MKIGVITGLLTGRDNETHDIGRWAIAAGTITIIAVAIPVAIMAPEAAVITAVGTALGTFLGGAGILMKGKENQEPHAAGGHAAESSAGSGYGGSASASGHGAEPPAAHGSEEED